MKLRLRKVCTGLAWLYASTVLLWFILHSWLGDSVWWLALLNSFTPYFFGPILLLLPACFFRHQRSLRLALAIPMLIFIVLYGELFVPRWATPSMTADTPLTIMTFNIWGGSDSPETAQVILDNHSPDIVALQELTPQMAEVLLQEVGKSYPYRILDPQPQPRGMGILSRYPLTEIDASHLFTPGWQVQIAQVETGHGTFTFYNIHPHATNILVYLESGLAVADEAQSSFRIRRRLIEALIADIQKWQGPINVAGDFNSTDQSEVYRLMSNVLTDTHRAVGWGFGHTFPAYGGSFRGVPILPREMRIDMIFYSAEFAALSSQVSPTYGESDHLPLLAQLVWQR